jgi:hypothetical protein
VALLAVRWDMRVAADLPAVAAGYNRTLLQHTGTVVNAVTKAWADFQVATIDESWTAIRQDVVAAITAGQLFGASLAAALDHHLLADAGLTRQGPTIRPQGFRGVSGTGSPFDLLVDLAPIRVKQAIAAGIPPDTATGAGLSHLVGVGDSELQEASRGAMDVVMNTDQQYRGYLRHPNPGACGRCLILANAFYRKNEGFQRHPRCRCTHVPVLVGQEKLNLPTASERFHRLSAQEQDEAFGKDAAEAIRHGADPAQTINARSGMTHAGQSFTTTGTKRRRYAGGRLSPAGCRLQANGNEEKYLQLLKVNGYVT